MSDLPTSLLQIGPGERLRDVSYMKKLLGPGAEWPPYRIVPEGRMFMGGSADLRYTINDQQVNIRYTYDMASDEDIQQKASWAVLLVFFNSHMCFSLKTPDERVFGPEFGPYYTRPHIERSFKFGPNAASDVELDLAIQASPARCVLWITLSSKKASNQ